MINEQNNFDQDRNFSQQIAVDNALFIRCREICELEATAHDLVLFGLPKQALTIASIIPKVYKIKAELYSLEQVDDGFGHPVPAKTIFVNVKTLSPTEEAVHEALSFYLDEYEIGGYWQPEAEINEQLMF